MGTAIIHLRVRYMIQNKIMGFLYDLDFSHLKTTKTSVQVQSRSDRKLTPIKKQSKEKKEEKKRTYIEDLWSKFKIEFKKMLSFFFHKNYQEEYFDLINLKTLFNGLHDLKKLKIILFDNNQLKLFDRMKRPKISFSNQSFKRPGCDPGLKLMNLMRTSHRVDNFNTQNDSKTIEESTHNTIEEKLNFFNHL